MPVSPEEQAAAVVECLKAGAGAIHLHVRVTSPATTTSSSTSTSESIAARLGSEESRRQDVCSPSERAPSVRAPGEQAPSGTERESLEGADVARTLLAVKAAAPNAQIGVSTGAWILPHPARLQALAAWEVLPDFASVNFSEEGAVELARLLLSRGVDVEAGLCEAANAAVLLKSDLAASCLRVLLEPQEQELARALETVNAIEKVLGVRAEPRRLLPPILLHGVEATTWPLLDEAIARGYDVRIGLEDTLVLPDGRIAKHNAELVTEARRRVQAGK